MKLIAKLAVIAAAAATMGMWEPAPAGAEDPDSENPPWTSQHLKHRPATTGSAETFTGQVSVQPLFNPNGVRTAGCRRSDIQPVRAYRLAHPPRRPNSRRHPRRRLGPAMGRPKAGDQTRRRHLDPARR